MYFEIRNEATTVSRTSDRVKTIVPMAPKPGGPGFTRRIPHAAGQNKHNPTGTMISRRPRTRKFCVSCARSTAKIRNCRRNPVHSGSVTGSLLGRCGIPKGGRGCAGVPNTRNTCRHHNPFRKPVYRRALRLSPHPFLSGIRPLAAPNKSLRRLPYFNLPEAT